MREIKFRGKRLDNDIQTGPADGWVTGFYYQDLCEGQVRHFIASCPCVWEVDPATVGQYTGLKDRNGKEIYEGDIVTEIDIVIAQNRRRYQVVFETGATRIDGLILARYYDNDDRLAKRYIVEVVGNIHDNPELLKGGE